jgi:hypothetical protein
MGDGRTHSARLSLTAHIQEMQALCKYMWHAECLGGQLPGAQFWIRALPVDFLLAGAAQVPGAPFKYCPQHSKELGLPGPQGVGASGAGNGCRQLGWLCVAWAW